MRILLAICLICFTSFYTFSMADKRGDDDDDDKKEKKNDDDDDSGGDDDNDANNNNYLEVNVNSNLGYFVTQPEHLEQVQSIPNAIHLKFKTKNSNCSVFAKIASFNSPRNTSLNDVNLSLYYRSDNSPNVYSLIRDPVRLSYADSRLFVQPKRSQTFHFYYDMQLGPLGYEVPPGQYSFTILFTMTQP